MSSTNKLLKLLATKVFGFDMCTFKYPLRGEDGVLDGNGNITGHGVDPTGNVTDIRGLACAVSHSTAGDGAYRQFSEVTKSFEVTCLFNNWSNGCHRFIFKDARSQ